MRLRLKMVFQPGEAFQFDWSEDFAVLGGERVKLKVAHIKLSHSRAFLLRAYLTGGRIVSSEPQHEADFRVEVAISGIDAAKVDAIFLARFVGRAIAAEERINALVPVNGPCK